MGGSSPTHQPLWLLGTQLRGGSCLVTHRRDHCLLMDSLLCWEGGGAEGGPGWVTGVTPARPALASCSPQALGGPGSKKSGHRPGPGEPGAGQLSPPGAGRRRAGATSTWASGGRRPCGPPTPGQAHTPPAARLLPHPSGSPSASPRTAQRPWLQGWAGVRWDGGGWGFSVSSLCHLRPGLRPRDRPTGQPGEGTVTFDLRSAPPLRPMAPGSPWRCGWCSDGACGLRGPGRAPVGSWRQSTGCHGPGARQLSVTLSHRGSEGARRPTRPVVTGKRRAVTGGCQPGRGGRGPSVHARGH